MLNDDDALDLFKSTMKTPETSAVAFLQKTDRSASKIVKARALIASQSASSPAVALLQHTLTSALRSKKVDFSKVLTMIDDMVSLLGKEQKTDGEQKKYCEDELDKNDDTKKDLEGENKSLETSIAEMKDSIAVLGEEIAALQAKIADLDKSVQEASEQRKKEHAEFEQVVADNVTAMKLIEMAKNRLNKFYNPALYVAPPVEEMSAEDRIFAAAGGELQTTPAPTGLAAAKLAAGAFIQLASDAAPGPAPEGPSYKKSGKSNSVIALMDGLIGELKTGNQDMTKDEEFAQKEYEQMLKDAEESRAEDSKSTTDKQEAKAQLEENLNEEKNTYKLKVQALADTVATIADLHKSCDFLLENFEVRLSARSKEIEGLKKAKAVLSGADYSLF
jgi:chromosome segregation ATPase